MGSCKCLVNAAWEKQNPSGFNIYKIKRQQAPTFILPLTGEFPWYEIDNKNLLKAVGTVPRLDYSVF